MEVNKGDLFFIDVKDRIRNRNHYIYIISHKKNVNDPYDNGSNKVLVYDKSTLYLNNYADTMLHRAAKISGNINDIIKNARKQDFYNVIIRVFE